MVEGQATGSRPSARAWPQAEVIREPSQLTECVRFGVGYSIIYVSNVIRPGALIDPVVNPTLVPFRTEFGLPLGTARPMQVFHGTDYWAQGVNFTLTLMF